jgi:hypothetical protein
MSRPEYSAAELADKVRWCRRRADPDCDRCHGQGLADGMACDCVPEPVSAREFPDTTVHGIRLEHQGPPAEGLSYRDCDTCHERSCSFAGDTFTCATCERDVPLCQGHADDRPDDCTDCWAAATARRVGS